MPNIVIEQPGIPPMTVELDDGETGFGRAEDNSVVLVAEEVSRHHARIRFHGEQVLLQDLKSLNGTYVNRQRVVERVLSNNDEIWFGGKCRAVFYDDPAEVKAERASQVKKRESTLQDDLSKIRDEMDRVAASMTMMGHVTTNQTMAGPADSAPEAQSDESPDLQVEKLGHAFRRLDGLYKASKLLASAFDLQQRMSEVMDLAIEVTGADRGFLMMREEDQETLTVRVARGMGQELQDTAPSMSIARRAAIDGEPVLMADSESDSQFGSRESIIRQRILSAMCVPLQLEDRILGSLYVDSMNYSVNFTEEDLELFHALASQSAMAIENVRLYERMIEEEKKRTSLGRFLSPAIVDYIMEEDKELGLGGKAAEVTTMFCDIRGFTPLAEKLTPEQLIDLLNEHFTAMTEIIFACQGTLDKFVGDEVMALFGTPFPGKDDHLQAIRAAVGMQKKNAELNAIRRENGIPTMEIGIGINTGRAIAGYIGSPDRMDYTVLGDAVNIASRFCSVARGGQVVIGESTYHLVKEWIDAESIGTPVLKGKQIGIEAFEVLGLRGSDPLPRPVSNEA